MMEMIKSKIAVLAKFTVELAAILTISIIVPILIRHICLPKRINEEFPLNVGFETCKDDLHSVCSFPTATLSYNQADIFSPNVHYEVTIWLKFADVDNTVRLGLFQNIISFSDENGNVLKQFRKTSYLRTPSIFTKFTWIAFFPLYFLGAFHDYTTLEVTMTSNYVEQSMRQSVKMMFTLEDKFANIEEAKFIIVARFGIIRHVLYYWPLTTYFILFVATFLACTAVLLIKYALWMEVTPRAPTPVRNRREDEPEDPFEGPVKPNSSTFGMYCPSVPEHAIPGWVYDRPNEEEEPRRRR